MAGQLLEGFSGVQLRPGDDGYDAARRVWNAMVDRHPAVIARCASGADVAAAIRFAREHGLEVGVRGGGHSVTGFAVPQDGLMLDLSARGRCRSTRGADRADRGGGALLGVLDQAAQAHGLATTAGQGLAHRGRRAHARRRGRLAGPPGRPGLRQRTVLDGRHRGPVRPHREPEQHPELFWGLRGGGGNFGVVTEFEFRLHDVGTRALDVDLEGGRTSAPPTPLRGWGGPVAAGAAGGDPAGPRGHRPGGPLGAAHGGFRLRLGRRPGRRPGLAAHPARGPRPDRAALRCTS